MPTSEAPPPVLAIRHLHRRFGQTGAPWHGFRQLEVQAIAGAGGSSSSLPCSPYFAGDGIVRSLGSSTDV